MKKKNKILPFVFLILSIFSLASCSSNNEFKVNSFITAESSYNEGDEMSFVITLSNPSKFEITNCKINNNPYNVQAVGLTKEKYTITTDLKYSKSSSYILNEITYVESDTAKSLTLKKKAIVTGSASEVQDIVVKDLSFKSISNSNSGKIYTNDKVEASVRIHKNSKLDILKFYFTFTDSNGAQDTQAVGIIDDDKSEVYTMNLNFPSMVGGVSAQVSRIEYVKGTNRKTTDKGATTQLVAEVHSVSVLNATVSQKSALAKDVNDQSYFDSSSSIEISVTLSNNSDLPITEMQVSGITVPVNEATDVTKYTQLHEWVIKKRINLQTEENPIKLKLDSIAYSEGGSVVKINEVLFDEDYYYYNKIITKPKDFDSMKVELDENGNPTKNIVGNYILSKDITLTGNEAYLFKGYTFKGILELNGHSITSNVLSENAMFDKLDNDAVVENGKINYATNKNAAICEANYGLINNLQFINSVTGIAVKDKNHPETITSVVCKYNMNNGVISNIDFQSFISGSDAYVTLVETNYGTMKNFVVNPLLETQTNNALSPLPYLNTGDVSSVLVIVDSWFSGVSPTGNNPENQNTLIINYDDGNYKNIYVNSSFNETATILNKVIDGPTVEANSLFGKFNQGLDNLLGKIWGSKKTYYESWTKVGETADVLATVKESKAEDIYKASQTLGFYSYNDSNNCFWKQTNGSLKLNWQMK